MIALFSGMSRLKRSSRPARFPADPEASQPKYALAFNQLSDFADGGLGGSNKVTASSTLPAQSLCASAFSLFCSTPEVPPPPSKISKKIDKKQ
jgi:hypothetical protein